MLVEFEVTVVVLLTGGTVKGVDGVSYDDVSSAVNENGIACKGNDAEFDHGVAGDPVGGEGGSG